MSHSKPSAPFTPPCDQFPFPGPASLLQSKPADMKTFLCCVLILFTAGGPGPPAPRLRRAAEHSGVRVGCAVNAAYLDEPRYVAAIARDFNMIEPEDAMKWEVVEPRPGDLDFTAADRIVAFAQQSNMSVRGHTLVWHKQLPPWIASSVRTSEDGAALLHRHVRDVAQHFRGKVLAWDVVNEAFDQRGRLRHTVWYDRPGIGLSARGSAYIEQAFRWARQADPGALLFYNDAEAEALNPKSDAIYAMARDFRARGVPIDGVGLQMHVAGMSLDTESFTANLARLTALGLQVHITEMDVAIPVDPQGRPRDPLDPGRQAALYAQVARACRRFSGCTAIATWGVSDRYSWIPRRSGGLEGAALLLDRDYAPKPSYLRLVEALEAPPGSPP